MASKQGLAVLLLFFTILGGSDGQQKQQQSDQFRNSEPQQQQQQQPHPHSTTVCIEIKDPRYHQAKVCGPIVHGANGPIQLPQSGFSQQPQEKLAKSEPTAAEQPKMVDQQMAQYPPMAMARATRPGQPQPLAGPAPWMVEGMMPPPPPAMMGWRMAGPPPPQPLPCPYQQQQQRHPAAARDAQAELMRSMPAGMPMMGPMFPPPGMGMPMMRPMPVQREWVRARDATAADSLEERQQEAKEAEEPQKKMKKEEMESRFENLLEECEEKTRLLKEQEKELSLLRTQIAANSNKKETDKPSSQPSAKPTTTQQPAKH